MIETKRAPARTVTLSALAALVLLKLALLIAIGPLASPDTGGYAAIADAMRSGAFWAPLDLRGPDAVPLTTRVPGYPALLAVSDLMAGPAAYWLTAALQIGLGILAAIALYEFAFALLGRFVPALLAAAAYATGLPLVLDQTILTDGAYASLLVIFLAAMGRAAIRGSRLTLLRISLIGMLPAAALLLRESTIQVMLFMTPILAIFVYAVRPGLFQRLTGFGALILPLLIVVAAIATFNHWRTGAAFLATGLRTALVVPLVQMQARGAPVFDRDDPAARALRAEIRDWRNEEIYTAVTRVEQRLGLTPVEMAGAVRSLFLRSIADYPGAYAGVVLTELRPRYFALSVTPAASVGTILASRGGQLLSVSESIPGKGTAKLLTLFSYGAAALIAGVCWLAMAIGLPVLALIRRRRGIGIGIELKVLLGLAASHVGVLLLFGMVHIEARYLVPVQAVPPLALAYLAMSVTAHLRRPRQAKT